MRDDRQQIFVVFGHPFLLLTKLEKFGQLYETMDEVHFIMGFT